MKKKVEEQANRLKIMGSVFFLLAVTLAGATFLLPDCEANYWLSSQGKEGSYVLSVFFAFLGSYCFGATWRRKTFL